MNYPIEGYWRFNTSSYNYYECTHPEQPCLGKDQCKTGYKGILCEQCDYDNGYRLNIFKNCEYCEGSKFKIISVIIFIYLAYICLLTYTTHKVIQPLSFNVQQYFLLLRKFEKLIK
ncbi:hypothetical protein PPERSA_04903 [Pseudocohnilembus persalinus]|uniref:Uncharacterized protein n=1 Tax=Pseudocohnilembus persalinus TaxID=266149 RepID=A0A0V0QJ68_PSEPJ|nr:hypothetical protein PPERSA_04903 [Pseudocohnilembus persalinus]|eukprot:KRX02281.1 hypothetical protein PPERSA_04903 [Pseudocohnilembus persalinus]